MHGVQYDAHDVLADEDLRQGIKDFSNWPTIPQVFISGEFVGGCDILLQMHQNGELIDVLMKTAGIKSSLAEEKSPENERTK
jgi:monothiol glutaredoxin